MLPKLAALWERVRTSLWFLPGVMILAAVLFAWLAVHIDIETDGSGSVWWLNQGGAGEAGALLGALLTALITMATLVISITMVVLTLAAAQLGPRLIRSFVGDKRTQAVLGLFIATVVYILLIFRLLDSELPKASVPHFAVTMASVLVFICLLTLLFFLNHLARSIVADTVVNRVGEDLDRAVERNLLKAEDIPPLFAHYDDEPPARFGLSQSGYVQAVDYHALVAAAAEHDALMEFLVRPGHHVLKDRTHVRVWPKAALDDSLRDCIAAAVIVGRERTPVQDIEFSVRQLVEVALRALSPSVNDPFTAVAVIDRIGASLASAMQRGDARRIWSGADGKVRLLAVTSGFDGLVDLSFNQIRQASEAHPDVLIHLLDTLGALAAKPRTEEQARALRHHMDAVMETGRRSIGHSGDLAVLRARYEAALEAAGN